MIHINFSAIQLLFTPLDLSRLKANWQRLHSGDCEPWPESGALQQAWLTFHNGRYLDCAQMCNGQKGYETLRLKALSTYAYYLEADDQKKIDRFLSVVDEAETLLKATQENEANLYYQIAYSLGRYGQFISITKALAEGLAGKVSKALHTCLTLEPEHADAHTAFATYQSEIIGKLGKMAARLTYSVSPDDAIEHYEKGVQLAPCSVSAKTEYADGLLTLFGRKKQQRAIELYQSAVENIPIDALEAMDYFLAKSELSEV